MAKNQVSDWSTTPASNTDIASINITGSGNVSQADDAFRTIMAQIATWYAAAVVSVAGLTGTITGAALTAALNAFVGDSGSGGTQGLVPAPGTGDAAAERFLSADGTFRVRKPRIGTVASSSTPTPNCDTMDEFTVTALAAGATFAAPGGTPVNGQKLIVRIKDAGTAETLAFDAIYRALGVSLPTTTVISKTVYLGMIYNAADTKWDVVAVAQQA